MYEVSLWFRDFGSGFFLIFGNFESFFFVFEFRSMVWVSVFSFGVKGSGFCVVFLNRKLRV